MDTHPPAVRSWCCADDGARKQEQDPGRRGKPEHYSVTFELVEPGAESARLVGDFNGWNASSLPMTKGTDGTWRATVRLPKGVFQYRFIIDGEWQCDPANPCRTPNGLGDENSVVEVTSGGRATWRQPEGGAGYYHSCAPIESPEWVKDAIIYEVFVRAFSPSGDLKGVTARIPELSRLGATCLWLMPIHPVGRLGRKGTLGSPYAVKDHYLIDPGLGTPEDLAALVSTAHAHGMRVILDMVANHTSRDNALVSQHPEWFRHDSGGKMVSPTAEWDDVVQLNYDEPGLRTYMLDVMRYWVQAYDADGFRCDVASMVPVDFWVKVRRELMALKPDVMLLAESYEPAHNALAFDATYEGGLPDLVAKVTSGRGEAWWVRAHLEHEFRQFPKGALRLRYLENHDQPRAASFIRREAVVPAVVLYMSLPGIPLIYNGQEIGSPEPLSLFDPSRVGWCAADDGIRAVYHRMCNMRRTVPALSRGELVWVETSHPRTTLAFMKVAASSRVLVVLNLAPTPADVMVSLPSRWLGPEVTEFLPYTKELTSVDLLKGSVVSGKPEVILRTPMQLRGYDAKLLALVARHADEDEPAVRAPRQ